MSKKDSHEEGVIFPVVMVGDVDHGKSTLIGRLLHDTGSLNEDRKKRMEALSKSRGRDEPEWAFLLDGLKAERDQGVTIESTQVRFATKRRTYQLIDAPGHIDFLRNMVTGASLAEAAILLLDVEKGLGAQTKRHAYILSLMGLCRVIVAINKIDRVDDQRPIFDRRVQECQSYLEEILGLTVVAYVPISAHCGTNLIEKSPQTPWYEGKSLLDVLEDFPASLSREEQSLRCVVQDVYIEGDERLIALRVRAGTLKNLDEVKVLPSGETTSVRWLFNWTNRAQKEFKDENLEKKNFQGKKLIGKDFQGQDLRGANFERADLTNAMFNEANLTGANFDSANLRGAKFKDANLERTNLKHVRLDDAVLEKANLRGANLEKAYFYQTNLKEANLNQASLLGARLDVNVNLTGADLRETNLKGAKLKGAIFEKTDLRGANFIAADIENLKGAILDQAVAGDCVCVLLNKEIYVERGSFLLAANNTIKQEEHVLVRVFWLDALPLKVDDFLDVCLDTRTVNATVKRFDAVVSTETTKRRKNATTLEKNEAARIELQLAEPLPIPSNTPGDEGRIVLRREGKIVAGGLLLSEPIQPKKQTIFPQSQDIIAKRKHLLEERQKHRGGVLWMTGLSGSGKSTIASGVETHLLEEGYRVTLIDGDTLRSGLCNDLGFSVADRAENMRRAAHLARFLAQRGFLVLMSLVSPLRSGRIKAKDIVGDAFREIAIEASLATCEKRDPKGLYKKARRKEILDFTGISSPYEAPRAPDLRIQTQEHTPRESQNLLYRYIVEHFS